jgi:hypothetical protein
VLGARRAGRRQRGVRQHLARRGRDAGRRRSGDVERSALGTLRRAFDGFAVRFEAATGPPAAGRGASSASRTRRTGGCFSAAGVTYPAARVSSVRFDVLVNAELVAAACASGATLFHSVLFAVHRTIIDRRRYLHLSNLERR